MPVMTKLPPPCPGPRFGKRSSVSVSNLSARSGCAGSGRLTVYVSVAAPEATATTAPSTVTALSAFESTATGVSACQVRSCGNSASQACCAASSVDEAVCKLASTACNSASQTRR